ncbi:MAG: acyl-CoA thioesterase II [Pseudomonadales bacterium]|uniref:Acyl-CoA thioesterase 2 n=1 Tax=Oleiphilus messinensis TaxID=141451 RepID=A0A1Y0IDZ4_9GAMM|nr:acyl-CoA thioesterase II [Oleiphilus messinensis]ARU58748.1 acyl-CoA thioesterase II [Oleiphilus messinensis]MCG8612039.1 acyl-CoA thioesterase II [Pseudomonadales bacterium]
MTEVLQKLIQLLDLEETRPDRFQGQSEDLGFKNVFGGQVLGQALMSACKTVEARSVHSLHGYFLRPGNPNEPIEYQVDRIRDGGSFTTRRVLALQAGKEIFTLNASFQVDEEGYSHQFEMPQTSEPDSLLSELEMRRKVVDFIPEKLREQATRDRPIEIRPVAPLNYFKPERREPFKQAWFRAVADLPDDDVLHRVLLAYASDFGLLGTSMLPHQVTYYTRSMQVASLDHAIWFHRPFRIDDWLLYDMDSPSASQGRGFNRGNIYNVKGELVASVCQEALIRKKT